MEDKIFSMKLTQNNEELMILSVGLVFATINHKWFTVTRTDEQYFTGKPVCSAEEYGHDQLIVALKDSFNIIERKSRTILRTLTTESAIWKICIISS